ncbi:MULTISPECIES: glutathione S-transferase domain-containing protein [unclassified Leptolyngbya]|uniref:glutathione S-transferase family protein n=1 Tax=unclassified Leptolyngbya TaxID=2650499 RepID=UPI00321F8582
MNSAVPLAQKAFETIESLMVGSPYLLGNQFTIADFYVIFVFAYLSQTPEFEKITAQTPKVRTWWEQTSQIPNVKKVLAG